MTVPALNIRFALEHEPSVYLDAMTDSEAVRIWDWIAARPDLLELVARALEIAEEAKAA